jgi:hypothetical protein
LLHLFVIVRHCDSCAFFRRFKKQYFLWCDAFVREKIWGMSAQEDLTARFPSKAGYHPRDVTHGGRMEGQFWFFEKKRSNAIEKDPEKTEQAQGSLIVRKVPQKLRASRRFGTCQPK